MPSRVKWPPSWATQVGSDATLAVPTAMRTGSARNEAAELIDTSTAAISGVNRVRVIVAPPSSDSHHEVQIRIDAHLKSRRHERRCERKLDDRRSFDARAGSEARVVVDVCVDKSPLRAREEDSPPAFFRCGGARGFSALRLEARLGDAAHGVDADRADLDTGFRVARAGAVKLLVFFLEQFHDFLHPLVVEAVQRDRKLDAGRLAAVANREEAAELRFSRREAFAFHDLLHLGLDRREPLVDGARVGRKQVLAGHDAGADHVRRRRAEGGEDRRGRENINLLNAEIGGEAGGVHRPRAAEGVDHEFFRQITRAYDLASDEIGHLAVDDLDDAAGGLVYLELQRAGEFFLDRLDRLFLV